METPLEFRFEMRHLPHQGFLADRDLRERGHRSAELKCQTCQNPKNDNGNWTKAMRWDLKLRNPFAGPSEHALLLPVVALMICILVGCDRPGPTTSTNPEPTLTAYSQYCVVCGRESQFEPFGTGYGRREAAMCPHCGSLERHRLLRLFLASRDLVRPGMRILHISPQAGLESFFRGFPGIEYLTSEYGGGSADLHLNLTEIELPDDSIDAILCLHVLEHIEQDRKAMQEIHRILRPEGWAILQVPIFRDRPETFEDPSVMSPEAREDAFGQSNHVRVYGWQDYRDLLKESGFDVHIDDFVSLFDTKAQQRMGLDGKEWIHVCKKPL